MAKSIDYTVAYSSDQGIVDLCKILFGGDGSYYVTAPYHPADKAIAAKVVVNFAKQDGLFQLDDAVELAVLDDDERRLKVSHHPDGFLQFSGSGVRSGLDDQGRPKGLGVFSWPLTQPTFGPSFQLAFSDPHACGRATKANNRTVVLPEAEIEHNEARHDWPHDHRTLLPNAMARVRLPHRKWRVVDQPAPPGHAGDEATEGTAGTGGLRMGRVHRARGTST
jgi:hypothetical protein